MANHFDKRTDPRLLVDGAKSVISVLQNYYPGDEFAQPEGAPRISRYAWGKDYHKVLKRGLYRVLEYIQEDEYVEVTPNSIRLRKMLLKEHERKRANRSG